MGVGRISGPCLLRTPLSFPYQAGLLTACFDSIPLSRQGSRFREDATLPTQPSFRSQLGAPFLEMIYRYAWMSPLEQVFEWLDMFSCSSSPLVEAYTEFLALLPPPLEEDNLEMRVSFYVLPFFSSPFFLLTLSPSFFLFWRTLEFPRKAVWFPFETILPCDFFFKVLFAKLTLVQCADVPILVCSFDQDAV